MGTLLENTESGLDGGAHIDVYGRGVCVWERLVLGEWSYVLNLSFLVANKPWLQSANAFESVPSAELLCAG